MQQQNFVEALVQNLEPVQPAPSVGRVLLGWACLSGTVVVVGLLAAAPLREGALAALLTFPRYAAEWGFALIASFAAIAAGLEIGVPGQQDHRRLVALSIVAGGAWLGLVLVGAFLLGRPTGMVGPMVGKREGCELMVAALSAPAFGLAVAALHRRALFAGPGAYSLLAAGAAALPASAMQLACRYDPQHTLTHHLLPVLIAAGIGAALGYWARRRP